MFHFIVAKKQDDVVARAPWVWSGQYPLRVLQETLAGIHTSHQSHNQYTLSEISCVGCHTDMTTQFEEFEHKLTVVWAVQ